MVKPNVKNVIEFQIVPVVSQKIVQSPQESGQQSLRIPIGGTQRRRRRQLQL